jgi:hypothetical protein
LYQNQPSIFATWKAYTPYMSWQHITESQNVFAKLAEATLRIRRVALSRHIRHLENLVVKNNWTRRSSSCVISDSN